MTTTAPPFARVAFSPMDPELTGSDGVQAFFPDAGRPEPEDLRFLVALNVDPQDFDGVGNATRYPVCRAQDDERAAVEVTLRLT